MKKFQTFFFFLFIIITIKAEELTQNSHNDSLSFAVESPVQQHSKIKCQALLIGGDDLLAKVGKIIKFDLAFTDQLDIDLKKSKSELSPEILSKLFEKEISLFLSLTQKNNNKIKATLKDTSSNTTVFEKEFECNKNNIVFDAHKISDELIPMLTGERGICLSSLAYCKMLSTKQKVICIADYGCKKEKTVVPTNTINVAPCWHSKAPVLFYSQFTKTNNRLMSIDLKTLNQKVICSYDGINMQPSFSEDGSKAVLCLSGGKNSELYFYDQVICKKLGKRSFLKLTNNRGTNVSPCLLPDGNVIFCSDFKTGLPQIFYLNRKTGTTKMLTSGNGYCAAPSYCPKTNSIVYTRAVNHTFQLFTLNLDNLKEKQLTFNDGNKHEPSPSECGRFIAFSYDYEYKPGHRSPQVAALNCNSGKIHILTTGKEPKSFPRWTKDPIYI